VGRAGAWGPRLRSWARATREVLVTSYRAWRDDRCVRLGAGLAYYGLFALVPVLTLTMAMAGLVFSRADVQTFLAGVLARAFGQDLDQVAAQLAATFAGGRLTTQLGVIGLVSLVVAASVVFVAFQDALNLIWHVPYQAGLRQTVRRRVVAFGVVLVAGGVVVTIVAAESVVVLLGDLLPSDSAVLTLLTGVASDLVPVVVLTAAMALQFAVLPHAPVSRRAAVVGGAVTALVMVASVAVVGWYLRRFGGSSAPGVAGSAFVVLSAIYVQGQVVLAGAELTKVLTHRWHHPGAPGDAPETRA
jgi:membrane protein